MRTQLSKSCPIMRSHRWIVVELVGSRMRQRIFYIAARGYTPVRRTPPPPLVDLATRHRSQVVLENLSGLTFRGAKRKPSNFNRILNRMQMAKLQQILDYKLPVAGLPKPKTVSAAWTSQTCPNCGLQDKANRLKSTDPAGDGFILDRFMCVSCGYADDADLNAARVIGMKKVWRDGLPAAQKSNLMSELTTDYSFRTFLRDRAARRDAAWDGGSAGANNTSGGRDAAAGLDQQPLHGADNPPAAQHPSRGQDSPTRLSEVSSSSEIPHLPMTGTANETDP